MTLRTVRHDIADWIRALRKRLALTQAQLAEQLGVTLVTVSRWENGQVRPNPLSLKILTALDETDSNPVSSLSQIHPPAIHDGWATYVTTSAVPALDFRAESEAVRLFVEGVRLRHGHLFSPSFSVEIAQIDPVPHQDIAVQQMLSQPRLRFLLADDAGAGKTIMTGLYIREMLNRRLIKRVLIVPPAGLVANWKREMRTLFSLHFREVTGQDCRSDNPFAGDGSNLLIVSVDTLAGDRSFERLADPETGPYDLVVFDEAHKLSATRNADLTYDTTDRHKLAELLAGAEPLQETRPPRRLLWHAHHLLLLTATPHMGKEFPYYALWRLLSPNLLSTLEAFYQFPKEARANHFLRRTKEEMVRYDGHRIFPTRESNTVGYDLTPLERQLYEEMTSYIRTYYNRAQMLNRSAARLAMTVLQRRAASSTLALLRSIERRLDRLDKYIAAIMANKLNEEEMRGQQDRLRVFDIEDQMTSEEETAEDGREQRDMVEDEAMGATSATNLADLHEEKQQVSSLLDLAQHVQQEEDSKFEKLREIIQDEQFKGEKMLIFTEHRDTMDFLVRRLEALGYTGEVARIHGGMPYPDREVQVEEFRTKCRFMVATDAAGEGINLQFCWIMVNYDIPWNPARIEQRFGRIHRYKQTHDPVVMANIVANETREGRVLKTLLEKLERIRRELGSDKVFDVVGRQLQGISLSEIIMRAVAQDRADEESRDLEDLLTAQQVRAIEESDAKLRVGGDVASQLPGLIAQREGEQFNRLLPGYVRRFLEKTAPRLGIGIAGELTGCFYLERLPLALALALEEAAGGRPLPLTVHKPEQDEKTLFLRPGEPFFDRYSAYFCERVSQDALRGAAFVDPYGTEPYLYHLGMVSAVRRPDPHFPEAFGSEQVLEMRLVALTQALDGEPRECPVELLMVVRPATHVSPLALPSTEQVSQSLIRARTYLQDAVAEPMARRQTERLAALATTSETFIQAGFDYQEAELLQSRAKLREKAQAGDTAANGRLETVKKKQRAIAAQRERAMAVLRREPELVEVGEIILLAHALVLPSTDPADRQRHDKEVEGIAMQVSRTYEESFGARVDDVSTPELAWQAGLHQHPGFDLLSHHPGGEKRCIEVKGRRAVGDIELTENEWAKAANLRREYWLYVVYDCATAHPKLLRVQDPFQKLLVRAKGGVIIDEARVFEAAEEG